MGEPKLTGKSSEAATVCLLAGYEALTERFEGRLWSAELRRLRDVFLTAIGADDAQINASFCKAIRTANQQKSVSLAMRAEASYAEYRARKGNS
jgi:hypothetical protein